MDYIIRNREEETVAYLDEEGCFTYKHPHHGRWMKIKRVLGNNLIVRLDQKATKSQTKLLFLPGSMVRRPFTGIVLMKGAGKKTNDPDTIPMNDFEVGQRLLFRPITGMPIYFDNDIEVYHFRAESIYAIIEGIIDDPNDLPYQIANAEHLDYEEEVDPENIETITLDDNNM